jgi:hypothetical protein
VSDPKTTFTALFPSLPTFEVRPAGLTMAALIGEAFELRALLNDGDFTGAILSAPDGSTAEWDGSSFEPDVAGRYRLTAQNGTNQLIAFDVVALPAEAATCDAVLDRNFSRRAPWKSLATVNRNGGQVRDVLHRLVNGAFGSFSDATFAALDADQPIPVGLDASKF